MEKTIILTSPIIPTKDNIICNRKIDTLSNKKNADFNMIIPEEWLTGEHKIRFMFDNTDKFVEFILKDGQPYAANYIELEED